MTLARVFTVKKVTPPRASPTAVHFDPFHLLLDLNPRRSDKKDGGEKNVTKLDFVHDVVFAPAVD